MPARKLVHVVRGALATLFLALCCSACGGGLSGSSTCRDFMNASADQQQQIVDKLAAQYHKPDYTTPLGAPEVPYFCAANPDVTLDQFFQNAAG